MTKLRLKKNKGMTLISLVVTIIILIILAAVTIRLVLGDNGIINKAQTAADETTKEAATEAMNFKITSAQIETYGKEQRMPTLQELADDFCEDEDFEYVELATKKTASLSKIEVGENESIFTKLKEYPYEFEINSSLQLASIDGIQVATSDTITIDREEYENLLQRIQNLEENSIKYIDYNNLLATMTTKGASYTATENCAIVGVIRVNDGYGANVCVNGKALASLYDKNSGSNEGAINIVVYAKKGDVITTRDTHGVYDLSVYGLQ